VVSTKHAERNFRIKEVAARLNLGRETTRKIVMDTPGVLKVQLGSKRSRTTYLVPESVAEKIYARLTGAA
jgi:hypothetical protein